MRTFKVYVKPNERGYITEVNSSGFLSDLTEWVYIDEGTGDKYHHAQGNYFDKPIMTESGVWQYRFESGMVRECTAEEIAEQEAALPEPTPSSSLEARMSIVENDLAVLAEKVDVDLADADAALEYLGVI